MGGESAKGTEGETPPEPKKRKTKMVQVYNKHPRRKFFLKGGKIIGPRETGYMPEAMFMSPKIPPWIVRAARGDVIE